MEWCDTTVAVTGATGFLGTHLVDALRARGAPVVAVVRNPDKAGHLGATLRRADLADEGALAAAFEGAHAVIANAALSPGHASYDRAEFERANVTGTENTLRAAARAGARRVVVISSVAVYRTQPMRRVSEDDALRDPDAWDWNRFTTQPGYTATKAIAERRAWELAGELGLELTALRPGPIYGPRDGKLTARYHAAMSSWVRFAPTARVAHVHAGDVAAAACAAIERPVAIGRAYNLGGPPVSPFAVLRAWKRLRGGGPVVVPLPVPVWVAFDDRRAEEELGVRLRDIDAGLADTVPWFTSSAG